MANSEQALLKFGYMLWGFLIAFGIMFGFILLTDTGTAQGTQMNETQEGIVATSEKVSVSVGEDHTVSVDIDMDGLQATTVVDPDTERVTTRLQSRALTGDTAAAANTGLCAVGLAQPDAPTSVSISTNGEARVNMTADPEQSADPGPVSPEEVIDECGAG